MMSTSSSDAAAAEAVTLSSVCACQKCTIAISLPKQGPTLENNNNALAVDCHCPSCRRFHVAAFASYLHVPAKQVHWEQTTTTTASSSSSSSLLTSYSEICDELGPVERLFCSTCYSKMATRPKAPQSADDEEGEKMILVNMGGLVDETIPKEYQRAWQTQRRLWQAPSKAAWLEARPLNKTTMQQRSVGMPALAMVRNQITKGGCACGKYQYEMKHRPVELQHCYCQLCRQLSGSAFMTWIPVYNQDFQWTTTASPSLHRTTRHGQRHFCTDCGSALTIVYDDQPDMTWPAAGSLHDDAIPATRDEFGMCLNRTCHICMKWKQTWYQLPEDGCQRIQYAG